MSLQMNLKVEDSAEPSPERRFIKAIGQNIKMLRKQRGLTQAQVSTLMSSDKRYYQRIEAGQVGLTIASLQKIARALDVTVAKLVEVDGNELPS